MKFQIIVLSILLGFAACKSAKVKEGVSQKTPSQKVDLTPEEDYQLKKMTSFEITDVVGCWLDSREEYQGDSGEKVFRPCDSDNIPPSRFRYKIIFNEDLTCSWLNLSPNDGHFMTNGSWNLEEGNQVVIYDENVQPISIFKIDVVDDEILKTKIE